MSGRREACPPPHTYTHTDHMHQHTQHAPRHAHRGTPPASARSGQSRPGQPAGCPPQPSASHAPAGAPAHVGHWMNEEQMEWRQRSQGSISSGSDDKQPNERQIRKLLRTASGANCFFSRADPFWEQAHLTAIGGVVLALSSQMCQVHTRRQACTATVRRDAVGSAVLQPCGLQTTADKETVHVRRADAGRDAVIHSKPPTLIRSTANSR